MFLIVLHAHSKWIDVCLLASTDAEHIIDELMMLMTTYGLPEDIVSDNGPKFISDIFKEFLRTNGIKQTVVPPYHPLSNGMQRGQSK